MIRHRANILTQQADPPTAPISFTLGFDRPAAVVRLLRAALWAATASGVTHPAWQAYALDDHGDEIATTEEPLLGSYSSVPAKWYELRPPAARTMSGLRIESDFRDKTGRPFAGFQGVLIQEIQLIY